MREIAGRSRVLVIGAGPAGCAAGLALRARGVEVCVVDRARFPRDKTCGDALSNRACALLASLGIEPAALVEGQGVVRRGVVRFPDGTRLARRYDAPGRIVPRRKLDAALHDALAGSGVRLFDATSVASLERTSAGAFVASGPRFRWEADTVIAADGPGSVAWRASGRGYPRGRALGLPATQYLEGVRPSADDDAAVHWLEADLPCGYGWAFPAVDGRTNVGVWVRADAHDPRRAPLRMLLERFLARHPERFAGARAVSPVRVWPLPLAPAPWPRAEPGLLFVGDAAALADPLSGEGIWQALRSGQLAAEAVAAEAGDEAGRRAAAEAYLRACVREFGREAALRSRAQDALRAAVERGWYRFGPVRAALDLFYGHGLLDRMKVVGRRLDGG